MWSVPWRPGGKPCVRCVRRQLQHTTPSTRPSAESNPASAVAPQAKMSYDETFCYVTKPSADPTPQTVMVTHPHHPLAGQQVTIVGIRKGADPDLVIQLPDGTHAALAMSATDYASPPLQNPTEPVPLLDLQGLQNLARLVEGLLARPQATATRAPATTGDV